MQKALDGIGKDGAAERTSDERVKRDSNGVAVVLPLLFSRSTAVLVEPLACSGGFTALSARICWHRFGGHYLKVLERNNFFC